MDRTPLKNLTITAMLLALGLILPFITGQIQAIGNMLLPMHIPVILCGLICGWKYGLGLGLSLPLIRSLIFGMPPMYPVATAMAFELGTYGLAVGLIYFLSKSRNVGTVYIAMIIAMISGRIVWGIAEVILLGIKGNTFTWNAFISGALLNAIPGIILQLVLIPAIMAALDKSKLIRFNS